MKTIILCFLYCALAFSQTNNIKKLEKPVQSSDEKQIDRLIQTVCQLYGSSFKYFNELTNKNFTISKDNAGYTINITKPGYNTKNDKLIKKIRLNKIKEENGNYSWVYDKKQLRELIDRNKFSFKKVNYSPDNVDTIVTMNNFLKDMCIITDPYTGDCIHKVINRSLAIGHVVNHDDGNPSPLFYSVEDGLILPYEGGEKLLEIDSRWHSIIHFDRAFTSNIWHFGDIGPGEGQFYSPKAMTNGREEVSGSTTTYPIFVADYGNSRVVSIDYVARDPILGSGFAPETWNVVNNTIVYPYDIAIFKADLKNDDKIWISEAPLRNPSLVCLDMNGSLVQRVKGYIDSNTLIIYPFAAGSQIKLSVHHNYFGALAFIDNIRNRLVLCPLNEDGTCILVPYGDGYLIMSHDVEHFPDDVRINSVAFQKIGSSTVGWPYLWVIPA